MHKYNLINTLDNILKVFILFLIKDNKISPLQHLIFENKKREEILPSFILI